ncbi:hypothetical protein J6590_031225 [Homalodisca vitripennis]|nr:hypothetical protein J6590_031225 [Homalodisca vitripennis]
MEQELPKVLRNASCYLADERADRVAYRVKPGDPPQFMVVRALSSHTPCTASPTVRPHSHLYDLGVFFDFYRSDKSGTQSIEGNEHERETLEAGVKKGINDSQPGLMGRVPVFWATHALYHAM